MSLADLINERDAKVAEQKQQVESLYSQVKMLTDSIELWRRSEFWLEKHPDQSKPFTYLGMQFWPKLLGEQHEQFVQGFHFLYMLTLSLVQADALKLSVFGGKAIGAVRDNWTYEWATTYREDGWVEITVGKH